MMECHRRIGMSFVIYSKQKSLRNLCEKNSANRQKLLVNHCVGSKSFVRYREELRDAETLQELRRIEFYKKTHYVESEFGSHWTSPLAEQNYEAMEKLQSQPVQDGADPITEDDICDEILGLRPGYIRGLGHGKVPLSSSSSSFNSEIAELTKSAEEAEKLNAELKERVLDQDQKIEEMKATQEHKIEEMQANMEGMATKLEAFISKFSGDSSSCHCLLSRTAFQGAEKLDLTSCIQNSPCDAAVGDFGLEVAHGDGLEVGFKPSSRE